MPEATLREELGMLRDMPEWLVAVTQPERLKDALQRSIPEFASGAISLSNVQSRRLRLKDDCCKGTFELTIEGANGEPREIRLRGVARPTRPTDIDDTPPAAALGEEGWRCAVPELGLVLETPPPDAALPALPILTDPLRVRALLEEALRTGAPQLADIRIAGCTPSVVRYKPGLRCTLFYRLQYAEEARSRDWPAAVVAKAHGSGDARHAHEGVRALWQTELRRSTAVTIPEPLAFLPELNTTIQRAVPGESTLDDRLRSGLCGGRPRGGEELRALLAKTGVGLAALHGCGAHAQEVTWEEEMAELRKTVADLARWIPGFRGAMELWLSRLDVLAAAHPPEPPVPSHRSFRPSQVLVHDGNISFIDLDGFCEAEPAMDLALFRARIKNVGLRAALNGEGPALAPRRAKRLLELDGLCDLFLEAYRTVAPVSPRRVELWETLYLLTHVLNCWSQVKPDRLEDTLALLEHHLRRRRGR
jgi:Ser/Thr protein kinase RdoA (MazF antagonist)